MTREELNGEIMELETAWDGRPDIVTNVTPCHAMSRFEYTNPGEGNECAGSGCIRRHGMTQS